MAPDSSPQSELSESALKDQSLEILNAPAVLTWTNPAEQGGLLRQLGHSTHDHFTLSIHHDVHSNMAYLQFRASVALKNRRDKTNVLLSIPPEHIRTLALIEDNKPTELVTARLGTNTRCLWFDLHKPAYLVVPKGDVIPKQKTSRIVLDSLRALGSQTRFSVHLPSAKMSDARAVALCAAMSSGTLRSMEKAADIASLYGGKGGCILNCEGLGSRLGPCSPPAGPSSVSKEQGDRPPSYDDLPAEHNPSSSFSAQKSGNKRRRASSGSEPGSSSFRPHQCVDFKAASIEDLCHKMMARIDHGFGELSSRLDHMEKRLSDLETCVGRHAESLGASIQRVQDRSSEQVTELRDELDAGLYDVRRETQDIITAQVEDELYVAREHLEDYVKDELVAIEERLEQKLEDDLNTANVSLEFSWNR